MASMLLWACRDAARVPASAASRCAAVAAVSSRLPGRFPIPSSPLRRGLPFNGGFLSSPCLATSTIRSWPPKGKVKFVVDSKDLESDEALRALYKRWCVAFYQKRDDDEMLRRFDYFKSTVLYVDSFNKEAIQKGKSARLGINKFADGKLQERRGCYHHVFGRASLLQDRGLWHTPH